MVITSAEAIVRHVAPHKIALSSRMCGCAHGTTQMPKIGLLEVCPECGAALSSEACWSCDGTAASWSSICEECGGRGQLLLCPNRACHSPPREVADYWRDSGGQLFIFLMIRPPPRSRRFPYTTLSEIRRFSPKDA